MGRQIVTAGDLRKAAGVATREATPIPMGDVPGDTQPAAGNLDDYRMRLLKYIPAEVVAVYLTVASILSTMGANDPRRIPVLWIVSTILFLLTPLYLSRIEKVTKVQQLAISTLSFAVWVFTLGRAVRGFFVVRLDLRRDSAPAVHVWRGTVERGEMSS
jgi:hypothetical protein